MTSTHPPTSSILGAPPSQERLLELIDGLAGQPVVMLVDLVADHFITGAPKRISREAPVLILSYESESVIPGGGANAVANVRALGGEPRPVGVVGDDASGQRLLEVFTDRGIATGGILRLPGYRTPTKTRILAGGRHAIKQQVVRYDIEQPLPPDPGRAAELRRQLHTAAAGASVAVLSDYGYGTVEPLFADALRQEFESQGAGSGTILCDSRYRLADFVAMDGATPNEEEAENLLGGPLAETDDALAAAGRRLVERLSARFLLITRGSRGMALFDPRGVWQMPVHGTDQVADVTGAGDTVIGTFALAVAAGGTPLEAAALANYAGGIVVMKMGTATLGPEELRQAVVSDPEPLESLRWTI
jgi:rfaE bifunctional protein kinase chain/domain